MQNNSEFGPWISSDGQGPCPFELGQITQLKAFFEGSTQISAPKLITQDVIDAWCVWNLDDDYLIAYRIKRPKALQQMITRAASLPKVKEVVV